MIGLENAMRIKGLIVPKVKCVNTVGGQLCDVLVKRGFSTINSHKYPMAASLIGTAVFTVLAADTPNDALAVGFISISLFLIYVSASAAWAMAPMAAPATAQRRSAQCRTSAAISVARWPPR